VELTREKIWSEELKQMTMDELTNKLERRIRYYSLRTRQVSLRIKYAIQMMKKIEFHTKLKFEKSAYWKKTISFKLEHKKIKIAELKNLASAELKTNETKLKGLRDDLKAMQARVKQQFENGRLGQLSIVKNKALLIKGLIKETIKTIQAEKDGNFDRSNLEDDVKKLYLDYKKQND
jgi:hypothetical protein